MAIRLEGDWEGWLRFFLTGVAEVAREAEQTARQIVQLREEMRDRAQDARMTTTALRLLDYLFQRPIINVDAARDHLGVSFAAANNLISKFCDLGVLSETTRGSRNRVFRFGPYIDLFSEVVEEAAEVTDAQPTQFDAAAESHVQNDTCIVLDMTREEAEQMLAEWVAITRDRDNRVHIAVEAGVTKHRVHQLTGLSRSTIDRILTVSGPGRPSNGPARGQNDH